jgi:hypothetical protein
MEHEAVKVVSVDKERVRENGTGKWLIPFKLSLVPNESWARIFYEIHRKSTSPRKKEVKLTGDCLEVTVIETDNQQQTLDDLKHEVEQANTVYHDLVVQKQKVQEDMRQLQQRQTDIMKKMKTDSDGLKF